jgi:hypothetical protein
VGYNPGMDILGALLAHGFEIFQTASIVVGFFVTGYAIRADSRERKIENLFALTAAHRELWSKLYDKPGLARILDAEIDVAKEPPTVEEELFVHLLILHLRTSFKARQVGLEFDDDAAAADIRQFFARPIPYLVWQKSKTYQDRDFVEFVEASF